MHPIYVCVSNIPDYFFGIMEQFEDSFGGVDKDPMMILTLIGSNHFESTNSVQFVWLEPDEVESWVNKNAI